MRNVTKAFAAGLLALSWATSAFAQTGQLQAGQIWGNPTAAAKPATGTTVGAVLDQEYSCTGRGSIIFRGASLWSCLAPGTTGLPLLSQGAGADLHYATLANAGLTNSSITIGSTTISLGATVSTITGLTLSGASNTLTVLAGTQLSGQTPIANGGTGQATQQAGFEALAPTPTRAGDVIYWNGTHYVTLAGNNSGTQILSENASGVAAWIVASGAGTVQTITAGTGITLSSGATCTTTCTVSVTSPVTATAPTVQSFLSGSGTYTTPAGVKWIRVRAVGDGGGGSGAGATTAPTGSTGAGTTFGTTLIVANGGVGGTNVTVVNSVSAGGVGGTASLGTAIGLAVSGAKGNGGYGASNTQNDGGAGRGGDSCLGGGGSGGVLVNLNNTQPTAGVTNSGGGGGGAQHTTSTGQTDGGGGGGGGCVDGIINSPLATYSYSVGGGGAGGIGTGTNAATGAAGGSGQIIVEEHYNF